jgi:hypothetical protein
MAHQLPWVDRWPNRDRFLLPMRSYPMHRSIVIAVSAAGLLAVTLAGHGQGALKARPKTRQELMKRKLELSQKLLESLTLNDLAKAGEQAKELLAIRKDPAWKVFKTEIYEEFSSQFSRSAEGIVKASKEKNLEAAKLHYLGMTLGCFNCHSYVRDRKEGL